MALVSCVSLSAIGQENLCLDPMCSLLRAVYIFRSFVQNQLAFVEFLLLTKKELRIRLFLCVCLVYRCSLVNLLFVFAWLWMRDGEFSSSLFSFPCVLIAFTGTRPCMQSRWIFLYWCSCIEHSIIFFLLFFFFTWASVFSTYWLLSVGISTCSLLSVGISTSRLLTVGDHVFVVITACRMFNFKNCFPSIKISRLLVFRLHGS